MIHRLKKEVLYLGDFSILGRITEEPKPLPEFFSDLNLDQLIDEIGNGFEPYDLKEYYYRMPNEKQDVLYRQEVLRELDPEMEEKITAFYRAVKKAQTYEQYAQDTEDKESSAHWHLSAAYTYYVALDELMVFFENREQMATGWEEFYRLCIGLTERGKHKENHDLALALYRKISDIRYTMRVEEDHILILSHIEEEDYVGDLCRRFSHIIETPDQLYNILPGSQQSTDLEKRILRYLKKKQPQIFKEMVDFQERCPNIFPESILTFHREVSFYLSFLKFQHQMERHKYAFSYPQFVENDFRVEGGYDLALALKNLQEGKRTVSNDYYYKERERFFVVTGPNQGGKTTFGRAAGQLVYFAQMGLPVPADQAVLPLFNGLMTHFSVEESTQSGRGKLKEELVRLSGMLEERKKHSFVIINELFTSAATYDALHMGREILRYFLDDDCYGIYVTHIDKLAEENEYVVSMTASIEGQNVRTYKVERNKAEGKGYVESIVEKYGLTYDEIIRRLSHA